jgi:hypothetical protein
MTNEEIIHSGEIFQPGDPAILPPRSSDQTRILK